MGATPREIIDSEVEITGEDVPTTVVGKADQALSYAKNNGRNQISFYEDLIATDNLEASKFTTEIECFE